MMSGLSDAPEKTDEKRARCEVCKTYVSTDGTCNNMQCPTQQPAWEDFDDIAEQGYRHIRQAHEHSGERHAALEEKYPDARPRRGIIDRNQTIILDEGNYPPGFREDKDQVLAEDKKEYRKAHRKAKRIWREKLNPLFQEIDPPAGLKMRFFEITGTDYIVFVDKYRSKTGQLAYLAEKGFREDMQDLHERQMPLSFESSEHYVDRLGDCLGYPDAWVTAIRRLKS